MDMGLARRWGSEGVLRCAPFQEGEDVFGRSGAEGRPRGCMAQVTVRLRGDPVAQRRRVRRERCGVVEFADDAAGRGGVARELEDAGADGDPPGQGYRNSPSSANRLRTSSMSVRSARASAPSTARAMASAMASDPWEPSQ